MCNCMASTNWFSATLNVASCMSCQGALEYPEALMR